MGGGSCGSGGGGDGDCGICGGGGGGLLVVVLRTKHIQDINFCIEYKMCERMESFRWNEHLTIIREESNRPIIIMTTMVVFHLSRRLNRSIAGIR